MAQGYLTNPATSGPNDLSDIKFTDPSYSEVSPTQLPIRGEKRIIPSFVSLEGFQGQVDDGVEGQGGSTEDQDNVVTFNSFVTSAALTPFVDYVIIRIPHRGLNTQGVPDPSLSATYRFLINPETIQIARQTVDQQALARGGWQFGVWGEDVVQISLQGKTPGQYFALGLTDQFHLFTESYRNLEQLLMVYENNGYWFEGETAGQGPLAADFTRRRIKMHQDVDLVVGNFIWSGMFDTMVISKDAERPYQYDFTLSFIAWKERFRTGSPYWDSIHNDIQRGHSYSAYQGAQQLAQITQAVAALPAISMANTPSLTPPAPNGGPQAPAVLAAAQDAVAPTTDPTAFDQNFNSPVFDPAGSGLFV